VQKLIEKGADLDALCINEKTPLFYASIWGREDVVQILTRHGADENATRPDEFHGAYLGFDKPGRTPEVFAQNEFLTPFTPHGSLVFAPGGREVYWGHHALPIQSIWHMRMEENGAWGLPEFAFYAEPDADYWDGTPSFSADGRRMFFHSHRPLINGEEPQENADIWYVDRIGDEWGTPQHLGAPINTELGEFGPSVAINGDLYFIGNGYENTLGAGDIYVSRWQNGEYSTPENLGPAINSPDYEFDPVISPDGSYLLFGSNRVLRFRPTPKLFVSFKKNDGSWSIAVDLGAQMNQYRAWKGTISPEGEFGFFLQNDDFSWFSTDLIDEMRVAVVGIEGEPELELELPSFRRGDQHFDFAQTNDIDLGDLDGDGDLDAVFSNMGLNDSRVYLNDGAGHFAPTEQRFTQLGHGVEIADLDGDDDLDFVISCAGYGENNISYERPSRAYLNDGTAFFANDGQHFGDSLPSGNNVWLEDIDGDHDLDAMVVYYQDSNGVYLNNGLGVFTNSELNFPDWAQWGDLNGDGLVDLIVVTAGEGYRTLLNDGTGQFDESWVQSDTNAIRGLMCLVDLDSDADLDAVISQGNLTDGRATMVWHNDGNGRFRMTDHQLPPTRWGRMVPGDLNGDGLVDLFVTQFGLPSTIWLGDGTGALIDSGVRLAGDGINGNVALGDLDGDGDLDAFLAAFGGGPNEIWFNTTGELAD